MGTKLAVVKNYFSLLEQFETNPEKYESILHPEIKQTEFPNLITPKVRVRNLEMLLDGMVAGKQLLSSQTYEIQNTIESSTHFVVEVLWKGTIEKAVGTFKENQVLVANFCVVLDFKDGMIYRQRNYDCFEPFA